MGAFLGISAGTPNISYSSIVSLLASRCEKSPFAAQFVNNLMGPIFYELTMMALSSEEQQQLPSTSDQDGIRLDTLLKFLCFVYFESALQYESTEDVFETLAFCGQFEVAELQEYCATSLKSFTENGYRHRSSAKDTLLGKRIFDYLVLFLGGRIPFYFNEEELTLLHSVFIETILDVFYSQRSEFDIAQSGILWVQRKLMIPPSTCDYCPAGHMIPFVSISTVGVQRKKMQCNSSNLVILANLLAICSVNIFVGGPGGGGGEEIIPVEVKATDSVQILLQCAILLCSAIWTWVSVRQQKQNSGIILLVYMTKEGIIAGEQAQAVVEVIHFELGGS